MLWAEVESITEEEEAIVYDLEVPATSNFVLSNGILTHNSVDLDTRYGVNYCFATQQLSKTPPQIMSQCKYVLLPYNSDVSDIAMVLKEFGFSKVQTAKNDAGRIKRQMGKHEWILFDKNRTRYDIIKPAAPLSEHMETTK